MPPLSHSTFIRLPKFFTIKKKDFVIQTDEFEICRSRHVTEAKICLFRICLLAGAVNAETNNVTSALALSIIQETEEQVQPRIKKEGRLEVHESCFSALHCISVAGRRTLLCLIE